MRKEYTRLGLVVDSSVAKDFKRLGRIRGVTQRFLFEQAVELLLKKYDPQSVMFKIPDTIHAE